MSLNPFGPRFPYADTIQIGFDTSPGKATVIHASRPSGWDERKGYGLSGATLWPKGDPLGKFSILFELWDEDDMAAWSTFYGKYFAPEAKLITPGSLRPAALTILHPVLAQLGLQECVVEGRGPMLKSEDGLWSQTIDFIQYRKPKPAPQPSTATIPAAAVPQPTAQSALEKEAQQLSAEFGALVGPP